MDVQALVITVMAGNALMVIAMILSVHFMLRASQAQQRLITELTKALLQVIIKEDKR